MFISNMGSPSVAVPTASTLNNTGHAVAATNDGDYSGLIGRSHFFIEGGHAVGRGGVTWACAILICDGEVCGVLVVGVVAA
jgi:hypothetical protein